MAEQEEPPYEVHRGSMGWYVSGGNHLFYTATKPGEEGRLDCVAVVQMLNARARGEEDVPPIRALGIRKWREAHS